MASDNASNIAGDKGASKKKKSDKGSKSGRGKYKCGECGKPKQGHVCPNQLLGVDINAKNLESFIVLVTKLVSERVSERETLNLRLPWWWRNEGETPTQDDDNTDAQEDAQEVTVDEDESESICESEVNKSMSEEDNG
jgi:hypothetical protein